MATTKAGSISRRRSDADFGGLLDDEVHGPAPDHGSVDRHDWHAGRQVDVARARAASVFVTWMATLLAYATSGRESWNVRDPCMTSPLA